MTDLVTRTAETPVSISVIGAGSYGTSLAISLSWNGSKVILWGHEPEHMERLNSDRENKQFLPDAKFPDSLIIEKDLKTAVQACRDLLIVVPSHVFGTVLQAIQPNLRQNSRICWATKGLEPNTGRLLQDVAIEQLGKSLPVLGSNPFVAQHIRGGFCKTSPLNS